MKPAISMVTDFESVPSRWLWGPAEIQVFSARVATIAVGNLPRLTVTLGGSIAELCSRSRLPLDWEFATDTLHRILRARARIGPIPTLGSIDIHNF